MRKSNYNINGAIVRVSCINEDDLVWCGFNSHSRTSAPAELEIFDTELGLQCHWFRTSSDTLKYYIDVEKFAQQQRSFPAPKQGAFNQALGKKNKNILDATGGWGNDALLMCTQGYTVTLCERSPVMALLLMDAMRRLGRTHWARQNQVTVPTVVFTDAIEFLQSNSIKLDQFDSVYLDPMFPEKRKKSAAVNKYMQLLQKMIGADADAVDLLKASLQSGIVRTIVKRPSYAEPLIRNPSDRFSSKLVSYDVYLR